VHGHFLTLELVQLLPNSCLHSQQDYNYFFSELTQFLPKCCHSSGRTKALLRLSRQKLKTCHRYINGSFTAEPTSQCNGYN